MIFRYLAGLLLVVLAAGCPALPPAPPPVAPLAPEDVAARLRSRHQALQSFHAKGRVTLLSQERNYSGTGLLAGRLPSTLKVDILDFLGRSLLSFSSDGQEVRVFFPKEGKLFHGPASPRNLAAFIPPALTLPQTLRLLVGALPLNNGPPQGGEFDAAQGLYRLEWRAPNGAVQERLWVAAQELRPVKGEWYGEDGKVRFSFELGEYGSLPGPLPAKITVYTVIPKVELRLVYKEMEVNPPLKAGDLVLQAPPGVAQVPLAP